MVSVNILQQERAETLESARERLANLQDADTDAVLEAGERSGAGLIGRDYETAMYLSQVVRVLEGQQARISELEQRVSGGSKSRSRSKRGS